MAPAAATSRETGTPSRSPATMRTSSGQTPTASPTCSCTRSPDVLPQPETPLEARICADPAWQAGLRWGEPRPGHPEGTVGAHLADVVANVDRVALDADDRERLRLIALVHDTFKADVDRSQSRTGENHHAMRARRFAERHITDDDLLDVIELHDDAYIAWRHGDRTGDWDEAE